MAGLAVGSGSRVVRLLAGWLVIVVSLGLLVAANVAARVTDTRLDAPYLTVAIVGMGVVGGVVLMLRPSNRMGLILAVAGIGGALAGLAAGLGSGDSTHDILVGNSFLDAGPARLTAIAFGDGGFLTFFVATFGLLPLLFPTGRVPSKRWRWLQWYLIGGTVAVFVSGALKPELCAVTDDPTAGYCVANPIGIDGIPSQDSLFGLILPAIPVAIAALVVRFRRASGVERLQLKWLTFSMALLLGEFLLGQLVVEVLGIDSLEGIALNLFNVLMLLVPVSIGVAILRYRLYDIDRLVSRTVAYALVVGLLGGLFASMVAIATVAVGGNSPAWVVAVATLSVASLFDPLRRRIQSSVERRFDRSRFDARKVAEDFVERVRSVTDASDATLGLTDTAVGIFRPGSVALWVRR